MRFMMIVKENPESEAGQLPTPELIDAMNKYNEELAKAGALLDLSGLHPSSKGFRVRFTADGKRKIIDGPFAETKELIAGYWLIQVKSREEAIEWAKRIPFVAESSDKEPEVEVRQIFDIEDFPPSDAVDRANTTGVPSCVAAVLIFDVNIKSSRTARITHVLYVS